MPWAKGESGNPGGRPKAEREVIDLARDGSKAAIERLVQLVGHEDGRVAIAAANSVLDRAFGKPTQPISGDDDKPPIRAEMPLESLSPAAREALRQVIAEVKGG